MANRKQATLGGPELKNEVRFMELRRGCIVGARGGSIKIRPKNGDPSFWVSLSAERLIRGENGNRTLQDRPTEANRHPLGGRVYFEINPRTLEPTGPWGLRTQEISKAEERHPSHRRRAVLRHPIIPEPAAIFEK